MDYVTYSLEDDVANIVRKHEQNYDVLFFAGSLPYAITKEQLNLKTNGLYRIQRNCVISCSIPIDS